MNTSLSNNKKLIIIASIFTALIVLVLILFGGSKKQANKPTSGYYDSFSHQTISNPPGETPETGGANSNNPIFLGIDKFLNYGVTSDQLNNIKFAFYGYSKSLPSPIKEISIDVDHISTQNIVSGDSSQYLVNFNVKFDREKVYQAKLDCSGISSVRLYLINSSTKKVIFDSQIIDSGPNADDSAGVE
jgi:hypothetical protein